MPSDNYYKEIDGLRAISVLVIIFFHLKISLFQGGFIGVDVFFVVSGFLITRIIFTDVKGGHFSFRDFYVRRTARILPALVVTVLLTLLAATYLQQPGALVHTAKESLSALYSVSNFFFWTESNYWAPSAEKYLLLHTWSLGVEEQFYLVYPLMLVVAYRIAGAKCVIWLLILILIVGTVASEVTLRTHRSAAFYFTPLRFYEFALGGLASLLPRIHRLRQSAAASSAATLVGVALIACGSISFHGRMLLPGFTMLIPLSGAVLILLAGPSPLARPLLMNAAMAWLGKVSYSLYLTHWPIIVLYRYYTGSHLTAMEQFGLFLVILLAAGFLNITVEQRFRLTRGSESTASGLASRSVLLGILAGILILTLACTLLIMNRGWPSRMPEQARPLMNLEPALEMVKVRRFFHNNCLPRGEVFCGERKDGQRNIMLLGDSRGLDMFISLSHAYPEANIRASYAMGCPVVFSEEVSAMNPFFPECPDLNRRRLNAALAAPDEDVIFIAQNIQTWSEDAVLEAVRRLREKGKTVYLLGEFKMVEDRSPVEISIDLLRFHPEGGDINDYIVHEPFRLDGKFAERVRALGAIYVSNRDFFFDGSYHFIDRATGKLLTLDGRHLSMHGASRFGDYLSKNYPLPE